MPLNSITLLVLVEQVKKEGRVKGSDNLDTFIKDTINELLLDFTEKVRYHEMLLLNVPITLVDETGTYALPSNYQTLHLARYKVGEQGMFYTINKRPTYVENTSGGRPRYYDLAAGNINIFPFDQVSDDDTLEIDYYKYPDTLVDATVFPIPKLIVPVKKQAIYRTLLYNKELQTASAFGSGSVESEVRSRRSHTDG